MRDEHSRNEPFHDGEIAVQERTGERDIARRHGAIISPRIVEGALSFLGQQRLIALSVPGDDGQLWASVWWGEPGFVDSVDGTTVTIRRSSLASSAQDPVQRRVAIDRRIGLLAIDFVSRRRLRINGRITRVSASEIEVAVQESVPNCPKYIQRRRPRRADTASPAHTVVGTSHALDRGVRALVGRADTSFVGSIHPDRGVDVSHRGGEPGFIRFIDDRTLRMPDYPGNSMFLTLGNFEIDPRASLAVLDFEHGLVASFSGSARTRFDEEDPEHPTGGTGRYWEFKIRECVRFEMPADARWELLELSPFNPQRR